MNEGSAKLRLLYLLKILFEETDEDHPISTNDLIGLLKERYGLEVYRTTLANDISLLVEFGYDIYTVKTTQNKFFFNSRLFELPELKLILDAVESSKAITEKKTSELVAKLRTLAGNNDSALLQPTVVPEKELKPKNEKCYYIIDALCKAIHQKKKVAFQYSQYDFRKKKQLKHDGAVYRVSPYTLIWSKDHYYVVGYCERHGSIAIFRVDRIFRQPIILEESAVPIPEDVSLSDYIRTMFEMFDSKRETVELICEKDLMNAVVDNFGESVVCHNFDDEHFDVRVTVATSPVFYKWVFGFSGRIRIYSPDSVKEEFRNMVSKVQESLMN